MKTNLASFNVLFGVAASLPCPFPQALHFLNSGPTILPDSWLDPQSPSHSPSPCVAPSSPSPLAWPQLRPPILPTWAITPGSSPSSAPSTRPQRVLLASRTDPVFLSPAHNPALGPPPPWGPSPNPSAWCWKTSASRTVLASGNIMPDTRALLNFLVATIKKKKKK